MADPEEGIEIVDVRAKWTNEAHDFTPWLAKNLRILGEAVGLKLEPVREEQQVGSFSLDILARETNEDVLVAIENQLEWTDHSHLGQLLTYAAGCDARIAIWVADEFQYEHAEALHQLNQWTGRNIRFYGVKVDAMQTTDGSHLEAKFHNVVSPHGWNKDLTLPQPPPPSPYIKKFRDFFEPLIYDLRQAGFLDTPFKRFNNQDRHFPSRLQGMWYGMSLEEDSYAYVTLNIETGDKELINRIFDELKSNRKEIEPMIDGGPGSEWCWLRHNPHNFCTINMRKNGTIDDPPDKLKETRAWMLDLLPKLKEAFEPRLQKLLK